MRPEARPIEFTNYLPILREENGGQLGDYFQALRKTIAPMVSYCSKVPWLLRRNESIVPSHNRLEWIRKR